MNKRHFFTSLAALSLSLACAAQGSQPTGGKTNWLETCHETADCAELEDAVCAEGVCTKACAKDESCLALGSGLQCDVSAAVDERVCLPSGDAGSDSSEPTSIIDAQVTEPPDATERDSGAEFSEMEALFRGTISLQCVDDGDNRIAGDFSLQLVLSRDQNSLAGEVWGLPGGFKQPVSGSVTPAQTLFEPWSINWGITDVTALELTAIELDAQHLSAAVRGELEGMVEGDILTSCVAEGELALQRDQGGPTAYITPEVEVVGFQPIVLDFDEPVATDVVVQVSSNDEAVEVERTPEVDAPGFTSRITITSLRAWPSGDLTLRLESAEDQAGNSADAMFTLNVPERRSVTSNSSFEDATGADSPWFGCTAAPKVTYTDWRQGSGTNADIFPTDGAALAVCEGNGLLLQGYVEPPQGMTRLLIDVGNVDYSIGRGQDRVELSFTCGDEKRALLAVDETTDQTLPQLWTYAIDLEPDAEDCWLSLDYQGGSYEDGNPSGAAFVDHLRFE